MSVPARRQLALLLMVRDQRVVTLTVVGWVYPDGGRLAARSFVVTSRVAEDGSMVGPRISRHLVHRMERSGLLSLDDQSGLLGLTPAGRELADCGQLRRGSE